MGMLMLPPTVITLPFKIIFLFCGRLVPDRRKPCAQLRRRIKSFVNVFLVYSLYKGRYYCFLSTLRVCLSMPSRKPQRIRFRGSLRLP
jgi:hypothetical protein